MIVSETKYQVSDLRRVHSIIDYNAIKYQNHLGPK